MKENTGAGLPAGPGSGPAPGVDSGPEADPVPAPRRRTTVALALVATLLSAGIVVQVLLAGLGLMHDGSYWGHHRALPSLLSLVALAAVPLGFLARAPGRLGLRAVFTWFLIEAQYAFAGMRPNAVAALHVVNALVIFTLAWTTARTAWRVAHAARPRPASMHRVGASHLMAAAPGPAAAAAMRPPGPTARAQTALIVGVGSLAGLLMTLPGLAGLVAVGLGTSALRRAAREPHEADPRERGIALGGAITGAIAFVFATVLLLFVADIPWPWAP